VMPCMPRAAWPVMLAAPGEVVCVQGAEYNASIGAAVANRETPRVRPHSFLQTRIAEASV
jgi:hypothetical protein